jgi:anti-sigma B factor antagonist
VTYIDSSGIASLVEGLQVAKKQKSELALVAVSQRVRRVLELARLDKVFQIHPDLAAATAAGAGSSGH